MPLLPSALPPKGEARRYVANDFLNLIALPQGERLRNEDGAIPDTQPFPRGEGKEEAASPQKRKPTPPRCARQALSREGARVDAPSFLWKEGECRLTDFPRRRLTIRECRFPALSFRAKARNLFRSWSGKGCEDSGEREAPCSQRIGRTVFHADSITKENGNGKRKRSLGCARDDETRERLFPFLFNLLRKPTPPRCARQPLPREEACVDAPSFLWGRLRYENTAISFLPLFLDLSILFSCRLRS